MIKVIDQTIAAIEADNRKLLTRAITAEATVKALRERNASLQLQVDHCERSHRRRPRSVASQSVRQPHRKPTTQTPTQGAQSLAFDKLVTQLPEPISRSQINASAKPEPVKCHSPAASYTSFSGATNTPNKPLPSTPTRLQESIQPPTGLSQSPSLFTPVKPLFAPATPPYISPITRSPPAKASRRMSKHIKLSNPPSSEARLRSKPLPPLGPWNPSAVGDQIDVGLGIDSKRYRELEGDLAGSEREFITGHFRGIPPKAEIDEKKWI